MDRISCVIPAYNEEKGIARVLSVVTEHPLISEVIVVDDGSTDRTKDIVSGFPTARLVVNEQNCGKTPTICRGILESRNPYVLLLDADLTGLTADNITDLVGPVLRKDVLVALSLRNYYIWRIFGMDPLTGERVMPRSMLVNLVPELRAIPGYALEVFINRYIIESGASFAIVPWLNTYAPIKAFKHGLITGMRGEVHMWQQILSYMPRDVIVQQFLDMRRLSRNYGRKTWIQGTWSYVLQKTVRGG